jgi:hypothetical protein
MDKGLFSGRRIAIATKHAKEQVIAPHLMRELGLICLVPDDLDTDQLGTFSGEVERVDIPLETARKKCHMAMEMASTDLAIASEGSFGPHPSIPFIPGHEEFLILIDTKNQWEFIVRKVETQTNYCHIDLRSIDQLDAFLEQAKFPTHGLIVKKNASDASECIKGLHDEFVLRKTALDFLQLIKQCHIETDMRAMHNPTRMAVINDLTVELIQQIKSSCPQCDSPGFRVTAFERGLPCAWCDMPTHGVMAEIYSCQTCLYLEKRPPIRPLLKEDPKYCFYCNP